MRTAGVGTALVLIVSLSSPPLSHSQLIRDPIPPPRDSTAEISQTVIVAGESVEISLQLDRAPSRPATVSGSFVKMEDGKPNPFPFPDTITFGSTLVPGQTKVKASVAIPKTAKSGTYQLDSVSVSAQPDPTGLPIPNGSTQIKIDSITIKVEGLPPLSAPLLPEHSIVAILPTQKQYIRSQASSLRDIRDQLVQQLDENAAEEELPTIEHLIKALLNADAMLPETERVYLSYFKILPAGIQKPILFEDFHRLYTDALIEFRRKRQQIASSTEAHNPSPKLLFIQLKSRSAPESQADKDFKDNPLRGYYRLQQVGAVDLINQNIRAYMLIAEKGFDTFTIRLASTPEGATVSYWRVGERPTVLPKSTNLEGVTFPFAMWTFRFEKDGCPRKDYRFDPYLGGKEELDVELTCKGGHGN